MKSIREMNQAEMAAFVQTELRKANITLCYQGGAVVGIYSQGDYVSKILIWSMQDSQNGKR